MGVEDGVGFVNIDVSDKIESQIRLTAPFLCSFIKEGLYDDVFFNEIINSPEKVKSLLSGDKRKHFDFFKEALNSISSIELFFPDNDLDTIVGACAEIGYEMINELFLEIIEEMEGGCFHDSILYDEINKDFPSEMNSDRGLDASFDWTVNSLSNPVNKGIIFFRALRLLNDFDCGFHAGNLHNRFRKEAYGIWGEPAFYLFQNALEKKRLTLFDPIESNNYISTRNKLVLDTFHHEKTDFMDYVGAQMKSNGQEKEKLMTYLFQTLWLAHARHDSTHGWKLSAKEPDIDSPEFEFDRHFFNKAFSN